MATGRKPVNKHVVFNCTICLQQIVKPRCLPCSHTFCEECLQHFISREAIGKEESSFEFKCPICRRVSRCPEQGVPVEEWAKHFPANLLLNSLTTSVEEQSQDKLCAMCVRDNKHVKAEYLCNDCRELICAACKGIHKINVILQKHKISAINMKDLDDDLQFPDVDEPCHIHQGKFVEVFCLDHDTLCCSICFATKHRHCERVEAIDEIVKRIEKSNVDRNIQVLSKIAQVTKEIVENKERTIRESNARKETILSNVSYEIENLKTKLDECQQQFEKNFLKLHEENEERQKECVLDLKHFLLTIRNGESLLSAVQGKGSTKQTFITAMKIITDLEEQFQQHKANYLEDEEVQYEHDHTIILKQVCEQDKIEDVTMVRRPSGIIWNLSMHLSSFGILENIEQRQFTAFYQSVTNPAKLKAKKESEFQISGSAHQGVFVDNETLVLAFSSPASLKVFNSNYTEMSFDSPIELNGKISLYASPTKTMLYVGCMSSVYKLKIVKKNVSAIGATCKTEFNVKEFFDIFCVDEEQNRIVVATRAKITIITLLPICNVQTVVVPSPETVALPLLCLTQDRLACVSGQTVICFSLSGQKLFQFQIPKVQSIRCITFDPLKNVYCGYRSYQGCKKYCDNLGWGECNNCFKPQCDHKDLNGVFQIQSDGINGRSFITEYPDAQCLIFDEYSEQFVVSNGNKCTVYRLCI
ncbi:uncharacterized protein [Magallana gigas]|uniref:uncharacterized protein n=1 Tax=Magallana gigas TaxID=29159 RepID=UPI003340350F